MEQVFTNFAKFQINAAAEGDAAGAQVDPANIDSMPAAPTR